MPVAGLPPIMPVKIAGVNIVIVVSPMRATFLDALLSDSHDEMNGRLPSELSKLIVQRVPGGTLSTLRKGTPGLYLTEPMPEPRITASSGASSKSCPFCFTTRAGNDRENMSSITLDDVSTAAVERVRLVDVLLAEMLTDVTSAPSTRDPTLGMTSRVKHWRVRVPRLVLLMIESFGMIALAVLGPEEVTKTEPSSAILHTPESCDTIFFSCSPTGIPLITEYLSTRVLRML